MRLVLNKSLPLFLNDLLSEIDCRENIPVYKDGPISTDILFYLHILESIADSFPVVNGIYLSGDLAATRQSMAEGNSIKGKMRFFLGYSGWEPGQLKQKIEENTWLVDSAGFSSFTDEKSEKNTWKNALSNLGGKYETWSCFPQILTFNRW